jgi:hypothetical protein
MAEAFGYFTRGRRYYWKAQFMREAHGARKTCRKA